MNSTLTVLLLIPSDRLPWIKQSSVHFSPKKAYLLPLNTREKENIIKNTTATEKEELKLKKTKQDTYYKVSDRDQLDCRWVLKEIRVLL